MLSTIKKAAVTLAAALGAVSASAHPYVNVPLRDPHHPQPNHAPRPVSSYKYLPRYLANERDKCLNAIERRQPLAHRFHHSNVGFIQGKTYACRLNLQTGRLTAFYNLTNHNGANKYDNALRSSAQSEHRKHQHIYRGLPHW